MTPQAEQLLKKITHDLERDRRNQALIDGMKRGDWKAHIMGRFKRHPFFYSLLVCMLFWALVGRAFAAEIHVSCPTPGQTCKVLILTPQEELALMQQNGVLDTAAQARALDLGQFAVYLKTRIAAAPQGEVKLVEQPKPPTPPAAVAPPVGEPTATNGASSAPAK